MQYRLKRKDYLMVLSKNSVSVKATHISLCTSPHYLAPDIHTTWHLINNLVVIQAVTQYLQSRFPGARGKLQWAGPNLPQQSISLTDVAVT